MIKRHHSLIVILHRGFITTQIGVIFLALRGGDSTISSALQQSKREWPFPYIASCSENRVRAWQWIST